MRKMKDGGKVFFGIIVFLALFTAPIWLNLSGGDSGFKPNPEKPTGMDACIYNTDYMKAYHMDVLNQWQDSVVRMNYRMFKVDGKQLMIGSEEAEMSLTSNCMRCHSKSKFCDQCHNYMHVKPYCWDCHIDPEIKNVKEYKVERAPLPQWYLDALMKAYGMQNAPQGDGAADSSANIQPEEKRNEPRQMQSEQKGEVR